MSNREDERRAARERLKAVEAAGATSSLYEECLRFAESTEDGCELLLKALLFSEQWSRPPNDEITTHDARQAWDHGMHLKTLGEQAIAHAFKIKGDAARHAYHARKAEVGYPRLFWHSDAFLEHAAEEMKRAKTGN